MTPQERECVERKLRILRYNEAIGNVSETCRRFGISRAIFYLWVRSLREKGPSGLVNLRPGPKAELKQVRAD